MKHFFNSTTGNQLSDPNIKTCLIFSLVVALIFILIIILLLVICRAKASTYGEREEQTVGQNEHAFVLRSVNETREIASVCVNGADATQQNLDEGIYTDLIMVNSERTELENIYQPLKHNTREKEPETDENIDGIYEDVI